MIVEVVGVAIFSMKKDMLAKTDGHLYCLRLEQASILWSGRLETVRHPPSSKFPELKHASLPHHEDCGGHAVVISHVSARMCGGAATSGLMSDVSLHCQNMLTRFYPAHL